MNGKRSRRGFLGLANAVLAGVGLAGRDVDAADTHRAAAGEDGYEKLGVTKISNAAGTGIKEIFEKASAEL
jgi:hypothetical protein